ncbi:MAG: hypothetical protein E6K70_08305 [Planctomycetota bacterium]|nr:MAG: hypothetical protein E6K70_08305 [Planctomycetota bacterium]
MRTQRMTQRTRRPWRGFSALGVLLLLLSGCSGITVHRAGPAGLLDDWQTSTVMADDLSPRTLQTLRQLDLEHAYRRAPAETYTRLQAMAANDPQPDLVFALAEMSYILGRKAEKWENANAIALYYFCAGYAYHYLFPCEAVAKAQEEKANTTAIARDAPSLFPLDLSPARAFDPRFRLACDLYNAGLAKCIRAAQRVGQLDPGKELHLPTPDGHGFALSVVQQGFAWRPTEFGTLLFSEDFKVDGLTNLYRTYGLGVPLIGTLKAAGAGPAHIFYPKDVNFPVTAFFRFEGTLCDLPTQRAGRLELYNPLAAQVVQIKSRPIPLQTDLTTPLAYFLSRSDLNGIEYEAFLRGDRIAKRTGIYMFEPYQPGKIPVVMVHGLLSSPLTWAPLFNDLRADPFIRDHFQFWFYLYPTADPYVATAADLRQTLVELRSEVDPHHQDAALDQMVFVGHSMGGLVSKLLTTDSGDDFWRLVSSEPFERIKASPETRAELQRVFFFEKMSSVRRVIFLGTPHHGSSLSPSPPGRLLAQFIRLPKRLMAAARDLKEENPNVASSLRSGNLPTSLDLLAPHAPALELMAYRPAPPGVHYHSVIGVIPSRNYWLDALLPGGNTREGTDGVVPYESAHVNGVESEIVIPADHFHLHHHPLAVQEVRRILLEHLQATTEQPIHILQVSH